MAVEEPPAEDQASGEEHPIRTSLVSQPRVQQAMVMRIVWITDKEIVKDLVEHAEWEDSALPGRPEVSGSPSEPMSVGGELRMEQAPSRRAVF